MQLCDWNAVEVLSMMSLIVFYWKYSAHVRLSVLPHNLCVRARARAHALLTCLCTSTIKTDVQEHQYVLFRDEDCCKFEPLIKETYVNWKKEISLLSFIRGYLSLSWNRPSFARYKSLFTLSARTTIEP